MKGIRPAKKPKDSLRNRRRKAATGEHTFTCRTAIKTQVPVVVINKAGVKRELLDTVKARKLAYYGHTMRKQGNCLEK